MSENPVERPFRLAFIVTEFPKTTETFIMRDVMDLHGLGCEVRVFHLMHFNRNDTVHDFAKPVLGWAVDIPYVFSLRVMKSFFGRMLRQPKAFAKIVYDIIRGCRRDPVMLLKSLFIFPKSLRIADDLSEWNCDHVHAAYAGHPATTAWIAHRMTGVPFSCSSHAHDLFETQALLPQKLPEAAFVRTISNYNRAFILDHVPALAERPPVVVHVGNYLSTEEITRPAADGQFRLLYVGSLELRKGVDLLLRAVHRLPFETWQLDILGDGPEREDLEKLSASLGLTEKVTFHGRQRNEAVQEAMNRAAALVVPSRIGPRNQTEGLPTVIVEAFSKELPVIATRLTGIPEIVKPGETGVLFEMDDLDGLTAAILQVHNDPEKAAKEARNGRALVVEEFDQKRNSRRLYDLILEGSGKGASDGSES